MSIQQEQITNYIGTLSESRLCPTLLNVAVTASIIDKPQSGHPRRCSRVWVFHRRCFNSLLPLPEQLVYDGRAWTLVDGRRRTEAIGERRRASSSTVGRWEHKIEDVLVGRLHRSSISSQLVHSVLAQTYLWPYPPSIWLYRRTCGPGAISRQLDCNSTHQNLVVRYLTRRCSILAAASLPAISRQSDCNSTHQNLVVWYLIRPRFTLAAASLSRGRSVAVARLPFSLGRKTGNITS